MCGEDLLNLETRLMFHKCISNTHVLEMEGASADWGEGVMLIATGFVTPLHVLPTGVVEQLATLTFDYN
jgi:hypothetical protein